MFKNKSVNKFIWEVKECESHKTLAIHQKFGVSEIVSKLLVQKNVDILDIENYLNPTIKNYLPNPFDLLDMDKACDRIILAIYNKEKICIYGDYDVDGATSSALLKRFFAMLGVNVDVYIPNRIEEGYGINSEAMDELKARGHNLIISVDTGITAIEPITYAKSIGLDVVVTDHHMGGEKLPPAVAVINPNRRDEASPHTNLAGAGVAFMLSVAINSKLKTAGYFEKNSISLADLMSLLDLVALGTVCDMVALTGVNRAFVSQGLKIMKRRQNKGISALADVGGLEETINSYSLGFIIGPRINASGRLDSADFSYRILFSNDDLEVKSLAEKLNLFNSERKMIEKDILEKAVAKIEAEESSNDPVIMVYGEGWHEGVIGIVASKIKEKYDRPSMIMSLRGGILKASCRSVSGIDLGSAILEAKSRDLLIGGGGHAMAGGFSAKLEKLEDLKTFFINKFQASIEKYIETKSKVVNIVAECKSMTVSLANEIERLGPFGSDNYKPRIVLKNAVIVRYDAMGSNGEHMRLILADDDLIKTSGGLQAVVFNCPLESDLRQAIISHRKLHFLGELAINRWQGRESVQFIVSDAMIC